MMLGALAGQAGFFFFCGLGGGGGEESHGLRGRRDGGRGRRGILSFKCSILWLGIPRYDAPD